MPATGNKSLTGYRLSIRLGADGFSFSVVSTLGGVEVQTDRFPVAQPAAAADVLRQALQKPYLMDYRFQGVEIETDAPATIVPLEHFSKADMLAIYRLCFPAAKSPQVGVADMQYQILPPVEAVMVFPLGKDILHTVQECYPDAQACCTEARLLLDFAALQEGRPAPDDAQQCDVFLHVGPRRLFVAIFRRTKLLYAASQAADNDSDRIFLLLGIWKAMDLNAQRDTLHLEGASKELHKTLSEYILNMEE